MKPLSGWLLCIVALVSFYPLISQTTAKPIAHFTFDNGSDADVVNLKQAKLVSVRFADDRFGNEQNAIETFGNPYSYVNLGNYAAIKPKTGSISLWISFHRPMWSGTGYTINPVILTKNDSTDDYYEAFCIGYFPETQEIFGAFSKDSTEQATVYSGKKLALQTWHHVVITYDSLQTSLYVDGELEQTIAKNFTTRFAPRDSVLIGVTGNKKNSRYSQMKIDDIQFFGEVLNLAQVQGLYSSPNPNLKQRLLNWFLVALAASVLILFASMFIRFRVRKALAKEKERLELANKILETELRVNRALMNPHFIFNSLNGLHDLILSKQFEHASDYLVKFSRLIRKTLESNHSGAVSLEIEIDILTRYLEIESIRFDHKFNYTISHEPDLIPSTVQIPIMLLQPFVENAIWHGLLPKDGHREIQIHFSPMEKKYILCRIEDNGTGRKNKNQAQEKKSMATSFIVQRLELLNKIHQLDCTLQITDKPSGTGTIVDIRLPIL